MTVNVTAVNDLPTSTNKTVTTNEDTTYTFTASDFNYSDVDGDPLASVKITVLEMAGALKLNGADVTLNQVISKANIDAGLLQFIPVANANGAAYASFQFKVNDGTADAVAASTMTVNVTAVNDDPTVSAAVTSTKTEDDGAYVLNLLTGASDVEGDMLNISGLMLVSGDASGITVVGNTLSIDPNAYNSLYTGDVETISYSYNVVDGNGGSVGQTATITITGENDVPTVTAFLAPNVGAAEILETSYTFTVTYSDDAEIDIATLNPADVTITGPGGALTVVSAVPDIVTPGTPRTVTYTVTPPGGSWNDADNGTYTIALNPGEVGDDGAPKLFVAANPNLVTFNVTLPPTDLIATIAGGNLTINQNTNPDSTLTISESGGVITFNDPNNTMIAPAGGIRLCGGA
jgi:hypothetical protein